MGVDVAMALVRPFCLSYSLDKPSSWASFLVSPHSRADKEPTLAALLLGSSPGRQPPFWADPLLGRYTR